MATFVTRPYAVFHVTLDALMKKAQQGDYEAFEELFSQICETVDMKARIDELERVAAATLDADQDVWSTTDDGQVIPLTERIAELTELTEGMEQL